MATVPLYLAVSFRTGTALQPYFAADGGTTLVTSTYLSSGSNAGSFTTLAASSTVSGTGFSNYFASPPALGSTAPSTVAATTLTINSAVSAAAWTTAGIAISLGAQTYTDTNSTGTVTTVAISAFAQPTVAGNVSGTPTYTNAATVYIANAPATGTNATITNAWALMINAGQSQFQGTVNITITAAASTALLNSGSSPFVSGTSTTNFPLIRFDTAANCTTWSAAGTYIGINSASGFAGNVIDIHQNNAGSTFKVSAAGVLTAAAGASINGGTTNICNSSNFAVNISTGTTTSNLTLGGASNTVIVQGSSSGKISFFNVTGVVKQATTGTTTGFTAGSGTTVVSGSTFTGNTGSTAYTIGDIVLALKNYGLLTA